MASILDVESLASTLSWNTRISRTRVSTVDGLSMSTAPVLTAQGLGHVLQTVQKLGLFRFPFEELEHEAILGEGESFRVERCIYNKEVVAVKHVKHVKLEDSESNSQNSYQRLTSILLEIQIMRHAPLKEHPNILSALGYGWKSRGESLLPYVVVEYAAHGSLRAFLRSKSQPVKAKFKIAGDIASGLKSLHMCDIIHGDLKLDNVVVVPYPTRLVKVIAKLCDFGHSIILREGTRNFQYFGTALYNAPEVELQDTCKIDRDALHKCDIWAYGLAIWEIFADGARYFDSSWATNPAYTSEASLGPPGYSEAPRATVTPSDTSYVMISAHSELKNPAPDPRKQTGLGSFDLKHLRRLSRRFVGTLRFPGLTIEKGYLLKLLDNTLQVDPNLRPSQITLLPTMVDWDQPDNGALQGQLAIHTHSAALNFQMLYPLQDYEIPFEYQRQILEKLVSIAESHNSEDEAASSAFQASICYIMGFGTSPDPPAAVRHLRRAKERKHPMAILFGTRLEQALAGVTTEGAPYTKLIIQGFKDQGVEIRGMELRQSGQTLERFQSYTALTGWLLSLDEKECQKMPESHFITMPFMVRMDLLSLAIAMDDLSTVEKFAKTFMQKKTNSSEETALIQACRRGNTEIVLALLNAGADPETVIENGLLGDGARSVAEKLLDPVRKRPQHDLLNHPCSQPYILHPQWPLELIGTPLAFAILSNCTVAVEVLLSLGATPHAPILSSTDRASNISWTPIHLAMKYHLVDILHILLDHMSLTSPFVSRDQIVTLSTFELARSVSHSTYVERLAIHGHDVTTGLVESLALLPAPALNFVSQDGLTPFMEAIDFSNLSVVEAMLQTVPELATKRFVDPGDPGLFTYPVIFAAQIAARRESSLALNIVKLLLSHMPNKHIALDSDGRTPLHMSVIGYSVSTTKWLLENGYSPNICDNNGRPPLHQAKSIASLDILLKAGADIDHADRSGLTCMHLAALQGLEDLVDGLIERNANLNSTTGEIGSPLHCAVLKKSWKIVSALLKAKDSSGNSRINIDARDSQGNSAVHLAAKNFSNEILKALFFHGADANIRNNAGLTPLHHLVLSNDFELVKSFILAEKVVRDGGISDSLKYQQPDAFSAQHLSITYLRKVKSRNWPLIDFDVPNNEGRSPLHTTAMFGAIEIARLLVHNGADMSTRDNEGNTVLHLALMAKDKEVADRGGDKANFVNFLHATILTAENKRGVSIWDLARQQRNFTLMTSLVNDDKSGGLRACRYETLLTRGKGRELLHAAIDASKWEFVRLLLSPMNRDHMWPSEREARTEALDVFKEKDNDPIPEAEPGVKVVLTSWLRFFQSKPTGTNPELIRRLCLEARIRSLHEMKILCRIVSAAADYRALETIGEALEVTDVQNAESLSGVLEFKRMEPKADALFHCNNYCWCSYRICQISMQSLSLIRFKQLKNDFKELKEEALQRWETILSSALSNSPEPETVSLDVFSKSDLVALLRLAAVTRLLIPDRPINESLETENCSLTTSHRLVPAIAKALDRKNGRVLKEKFPVDPDAVVPCCSWFMSQPSDMNDSTSEDDM
ncbi:hypothetical protein G7Y89_g3891 [Cudoniella acicularis]|uniref:Protein kinase domain-containing protein n=1 Tax=Cudoniella acicularis TaxID=354080 RepID=A0A8H4RQI1_9HELO|nr:hypothetical protein G7Y89_g3891 [Cudoniella acicularis]